MEADLRVCGETWSDCESLVVGGPMSTTMAVTVMTVMTVREVPVVGAARPGCYWSREGAMWAC